MQGTDANRTAGHSSPSIFHKINCPRRHKRTWSLLISNRFFFKCDVIMSRPCVCESQPIKTVFFFLTENNQRCLWGRLGRWPLMDTYDFLPPSAMYFLKKREPFFHFKHVQKNHSFTKQQQHATTLCVLAAQTWRQRTFLFPAGRDLHPKVLKRVSREVGGMSHEIKSRRHFLYVQLLPLYRRSQYKFP